MATDLQVHVSRGRPRFAVLAAAMLFGALMAMPASPAHAGGNAGVYLVTPKWWGWCPNIAGRHNAVIFVSYTNTTSGDSWTDYGDDIIWARVWTGRANTIHVNVGCSLGHGSTGTVVRISPSRNGQTWWTSPTGAAWGN